MKQNSKKENRLTFKNHIYMMKFLCKHTPFMVFGYIFFDVMANLPWTLSNVVLLKYIIDVATEGKDFYRVAIALAFFVVFVVITNLCTTLFYEISLPKQKEKLYFSNRFGRG